MTNPVRSFVAAVRFLTRLPLPGRISTSEEVAAGLFWHPMIGACIGATIGGAYELAGERWTSPIAAVIAVALSLLITGGLHEDAFGDAADGLGGGRTREQIITIMKDSRVGAYGAMALWALLTFRFAALLSAPNHVWVVFGVAAAWGRWTAIPFRRLPAAGTGLASQLRPDQSLAPAVAGTAVLLAITAGALVWLEPGPILAASVSAVAATAAWAWYAHRRVGGLTGDLMGAGNQLVEIVVLLALLA